MLEIIIACGLTYMTCKHILDILHRLQINALFIK